MFLNQHLQKIIIVIADTLQKTGHTLSIDDDVIMHLIFGVGIGCYSSQKLVI